MPHALTLPTVAILSILGAGVGVHLGRDAIAQINPIYFSERPDRFHSELSPNRSPDWAAVQQRDFRSTELGLDLGSGCVGCRTYPEEYVPRSDGLAERYVEAQGGEVMLAAYESAPPQPDPRQEEFAAVQRYSTYAVASEAPDGATPVAREEEEFAEAEEADSAYDGYEEEPTY